MFKIGGKRVASGSTLAWGVLWAPNLPKEQLVLSTGVACGRDSGYKHGIPGLVTLAVISLYMFPKWPYDRGSEQAHYAERYHLNTS